VHAADARHLLLDGSRDRLCDGCGIRARVGGLHLDHGVSDVGKLCGRQPEHGDDAGQNHQDGDDDGDDGPIDEKFRHDQLLPAGAAAGGSYGLATTGTPSLAISGTAAANCCTFWMPSTTTFSPGWSPLVMIQFGPTRSPTSTGRNTALFSAFNTMI